MPFKVSPQTPQSLWKRGLSMLFILVASGVFPEFMGNMLTAESTQGQGNAQKPLSSKAIFSMNLKKPKQQQKKPLATAKANSVYAVFSFITRQN